MPPSHIFFANRIAAPYAREFFARQLQPTDRAQVWRTPVMLTVDAWLLGIAQQALHSGKIPVPEGLRRVVRPNEEQVIWEQILREDLAESSDFLRPQPLAKSAQETHAQLLLANPEGALPENLNPTPEWERFLVWQSAFQQRCAVSGWWTETQLLCVATQWLAEGLLPAPQSVWWFGFLPEDLLQRRVAQALDAQNIPCEAWRPSPEIESIQKTQTYATIEEEWRAAILWLRAQHRKNPSARLALCVPNLWNQQQTIRRLCFELLVPDVAYDTRSHADELFRLSCGTPLLELKAFQNLDDWWELLLHLHRRERPALPQELVSRLLRSPFWKSTDRPEALAQLELRLRAHNLLQLPWHYLRYRAEKCGCPHWNQLLDDLQKLVQEAPTRELPSGWANFLRRLHHRLGWHPQQEWDEEREFLQDLARMDELSGPIQLSQLITQSRRLLQNRPFYPRTQDASNPIRVVDWADLIDLPLDVIWITGLTEENWPLAPEPNAFLPLELQRHLRMPRTTHLQAQQLSEQLLQRWRSQARHVHFSCALSKDGRAVQPSPLLSWPEAPAPSEAPSLAQQQFEQRAPLQSLSDEQGAPLPEQSKPKGGTWLLKAQALCPARAYVEYRLGAKPLEIPQSGLTPLQKGNLTHKALENFWRAIPNSSLLWSEPARCAAQRDCAVQGALDDLASSAPGLLTARFRELEARRLNRLLERWMEYEKERPAFLVKDIETTQEVRVADMTLSVRVDRVDEVLNTGQLILLDYKTGVGDNLNAWLQARPLEPQLPFYAAFVVGDKLGALAFAQVHHSRCSFKGLQEELETLHSAVPRAADRLPRAGEGFAEMTWEGLREWWRVQLEGVAHEFARGDAQLSFVRHHKGMKKTVEEAFQYSAARGFCRVYAWLAQQTANSEG